MSAASLEEGEVRDFTLQLGEREVTFDLDEELYCLDAIYGAAYLFVDRCYLFLSRPAERTVRVRLRSQQATDGEALEALAGTFANELLNQVLRLRIGRSTLRIREQVMARAFASSGTDSTIAQLLAELDAEELDEEPLEIAVPWETKAAEDDGQGEAKGG
jgi:His-Xaa-Ser system protein HxsD